jgi:hypothetical protein
MITGDEKKQPSEADAELEREIRKDRKFSLQEAIGRMAGPGAMKGESPIDRREQAAVEIENWLRHNMPPGNGELEVVLFRRIKESDILLENYDKPLQGLSLFCKQILASDYGLRELVRDADVEWGRVFGERPYFDQEGSPPAPDDPYTIASVREAITSLIKQLDSDQISQAER